MPFDQSDGQDFAILQWGSLILGHSREFAREFNDYTPLSEHEIPATAAQDDGFHFPENCCDWFKEKKTIYRWSEFFLANHIIPFSCYQPIISLSKNWAKAQFLESDIGWWGSDWLVKLKNEDISFVEKYFSQWYALVSGNGPMKTFAKNLAEAQFLQTQTGAIHGSS